MSYNKIPFGGSIGYESGRKSSNLNEPPGDQFRTNRQMGWRLDHSLIHQSSEDFLHVELLRYQLLRFRRTITCRFGKESLRFLICQSNLEP